MTNKKFRNYVQFYFGLILLLIGFSRIENPMAVIAVDALVTFFICRLSVVPLQFIFYKFEKEPKHTVFGIDNTLIFGGLAIAFLIATVYSFFFPISTLITKSCIFFFFSCLDATFISKYRNL